MAGKPGVISLHGREYKTVALRVHEFREKCPIFEGWGLVSALVSADGDRIVFRAAVVHPSGHEIAVGFAEEERTTRGINAKSALECCETSAIGRALAAAGFAGTEYASADELAQALQPQSRAQSAPLALRAPQTPQKPRPHQSWAADRELYDRKLRARSLDLDRVNKFTTEQGWGLVSEWSTGDRARFLADIDSGSFDPDLPKPPPPKTPERRKTPGDHARDRARERVQSRATPSKWPQSHNWDRSGSEGPRGACLNDACSAIKGQINEDQDCPVLAPGEKHPDWAKCSRWFFAAAKERIGRDLDYANLANTLQTHGCKRPSRCSRSELEALLDQLVAPDCPEFLRFFTPNPPAPLEL